MKTNCVPDSSIEYDLFVQTGITNPLRNGAETIHTKGLIMEDWEGLLSDCCGAEIVCMDVCSACKEHCEPQEQDLDPCTKKDKRGEWMMECERNGD